MSGEAMPTGREKPGEHWNARLIREAGETAGQPAELIAKAWSEVWADVRRSLLSHAAEHERIAAMGGRGAVEARRRLAEMGQPTYAQQAIAERALAKQIEALALPSELAP